MQGFRAVVLVALLGLAACKRGNVDTTKDYYEDSEAPEYQDYEVNGSAQRIPWNEVPPGRRFSVRKEQGKDGVWRAVVRVPIVRIVITTHDKDGNPVDPASDKVFDGRFIEHTLNPEYTRTGIAGSRH